MTDCIDCSLLETRLGAASKRESKLLAELERAQAHIAEIERQRELTPHIAKLTCDRCGHCLQLVTSIRLPASTRDAAILDLAARCCWRISERTYSELGGPTKPAWQGKVGKQDLCAGCDYLMEEAP